MGNGWNFYTYKDSAGEWRWQLVSSNGPTFFPRGGAAGSDPPLQVPAGLAADAPLPAVPGSTALPGDALFYVVSTVEARVNTFLSKLAASSAVAATQLYRGYQREDGT